MWFYKFCSFFSGIYVILHDKATSVFLPLVNISGILQSFLQQCANKGLLFCVFLKVFAFINRFFHYQLVTVQILFIKKNFRKIIFSFKFCTILGFCVEFYCFACCRLFLGQTVAVVVACNSRRMHVCKFICTLGRMEG